MKLYHKKFFIYGNCMVRSFGQPGSVTEKLKPHVHELLIFYCFSPFRIFSAKLE